MYDTPYHSSELKSLSFLITGGAGFIGSNLVEYLLKYGAGTVRVLDNLATGFYRNIEEFTGNPAFEFIEGDIRDLQTCIAACAGMHHVLHQAALGSVPRSIEDPITSNSVNIDGFLNILVAARRQKVTRIVYAASSSTYGDSPVLPKQEDIIGRPLSPYAVTKYVNELYAEVFARVYGMDLIGLRYFNVFGPKQDPHGAYAAVIPLFMKSLVTGVPPTINGDGNYTRDFTFVENVVQANIRAAVSAHPPGNRIFNVAFGERTSLNELWQLLKDISGKDPGVIYGSERSGDIRDSLADISKIQQQLQYTPLFTTRQGLDITYEWFARHNSW